MGNRLQCSGRTFVVLWCVLGVLLAAGMPGSVAAQTLAEALDASWTFTTGGGAGWYGQTSFTADGVDAAASGYIGANTASWLETRRNFAAGQLYFTWKFSSVLGASLNFYVDGVLQDSISGEVDWQPVSYTMTAGWHTLRWEYIRTFISPPARGWVDQVTMQPSPSLQSAIAVLGVPFSPGGDADWEYQVATTHDGVAAAQSRDIADGQRSSMEVTSTFVEGYVGFWWKVSSEPNQDTLTFFIDGVAIWDISGYGDWAALAWPIRAGRHTLKWEYSKNDTPGSSYGSDCGWVDQLVAAPLPTVTVEATDPTATEAGTTTGTFTITRTGDTTLPLLVLFDLGGTAAAGGDYTWTSGYYNVTIPAGSTTATVTVTPKDDTLQEVDETVILSPVPRDGYPFGLYTLGSPASATVTIVSDDVAPHYTIAANAPAHGTISCSSPVDQGADAVCLMTPDVGYGLAILTDNGTDVIGSVVWGTPSSTYTIRNVTADHVVAATFAYVPVVRTVCAAGCGYSKIQDAVDAAGPGDSIRIDPGVYRENVVVDATRDLALRGFMSPLATLSGNGTGPALTLSAGAGETVRVIVEHLRVANGAAASGGGIRAVATGGGSVEATLSNVLVNGNRATGSGGGLLASASGAGSAVSLDLVNTTVGGNRAAKGGGIALSAAAGGSVTVRGCNDVIQGNLAGRGPNVSITQATGGSARAYVAYSNVGKPIDGPAASWVAGAGVTSLDPVYRNPARNDYHLHSDSPSINRGAASWAPPLGSLLEAPVYDMDWNTRPQGAAFDQGADEWVEPAATRVVLQSLVGGEVIPWGLAYNITWAAPAAAAKFKVYYSSDSGAHWRAVSDGFVLKWHVGWKPPLPSRAAKTWKVKVVGYTSSGQSVGAAVSPATFTVTR